MSPIKESIIGQKTYAFALDVIKLYKQLMNESREFVLSKQLLRSGTSIGAMVNEAVCSESKRDFVHKLHIALKEARETNYWLRLLKDSDYITNDQFTIMDSKSLEIMNMLSKIIITTKERYFKKQ